MTKLEKMINSICHDAHQGDPAYEDFEYDPKEGHYHISPLPPEMWEDISYSENPAEVYGCCGVSYSIDELKELRDWLNVVLVEEEAREGK